MNIGNIFSSSDVLLALFPSIEDQLIRILSRFYRNINSAVERKGNKINFGTPQIESLFSKFPHDYSSYCKCVNEFVEVGRNSPEAAIKVLFQILPFRARCELFYKVRDRIPNYDQFEQIFDLFFVLFFADCTSQILSNAKDTEHAESLTRIGIKLASQYSEVYLQPLKLQVIKQFSVIFSILSEYHLGDLLKRFQENHEKSDTGLILMLYRFMRLNNNKSAQNEQILEFVNKLAEIGENFKKDRAKLDLWARALGPLFSQFTKENKSPYTRAVKKIYDLSYEKTSDKDTVKWYILLCSTLVTRFDVKKSVEDFLKEKVLKVKGRMNKIEANLSAFLSIIRGENFSRSSKFWEWGDFNAEALPGVEAALLYKAEEDQSAPGSFTDMFFQSFVNVSKIEMFPEVVGDILINLASRDFDYFIKSTIPIFIKTMDKGRAILPLHACLKKISDPAQHFAMWAQDSPRNRYFRLEFQIQSLFTCIKSYFLTSFNTIMPKSYTEDAYCFELNESVQIPRFHLPFTTSAIPERTKRRIAEGTAAVANAAAEWDFADKNIGSDLTIDFSTYEAVSEKDILTIKILEFLPHILAPADLEASTTSAGQDGMSRAELLIEATIGSSRAVSYFVMKVINQLFVSQDSSRIIFYTAITKRLLKTYNPHQAYILIQLLVKLLKLNLLPIISERDVGVLNEFVQDVQAIVIAFLTFPISEIRAISLELLEVISNFGQGFGVQVPFYEMIKDNTTAISTAARRNIFVVEQRQIDFPEETETILTFEQAACGKYDLIFQYFFAEAMKSIQTPLCAPIFLKLNSVLMKRFPAINMSEFRNREAYIQYQNLIIALSHTCPLISKANMDRLQEQIKGEYFVANYKCPINFKVIDETLSNNLYKHLTATTSVFNGILQQLDEEGDAVKYNIDIAQLFKFLSWQVLVEVIPIIGEHLKYSSKSDSSVVLSPIAQILRYIATNQNMGLVMKANDKAMDTYTLFLRKAESYFLEIGVNGQRRFENVSQMNISKLKHVITLAQEYVAIVHLFSLSIGPQPVSVDGPLTAPVFSELITSGKWSLEQRRITLAYLANWARFRDGLSGQTLTKLGENAANAICVFLSTGKIFDDMYRMTPDVESLIIDIELSGQAALRGILQAHYRDMISTFIGYAFGAPPELAPLFFRAVVTQYYGDVFDGKSDITMEVTNKIIRLGSSGASFTGSTPKLNRFNKKKKEEVKRLTEADIRLNRNFIENSGRLVLLSLIYLNHKDFKARCAAFRFLQRAAPIIHHILYQNKDSVTAEFAKKLEAYAPSFFSSHVTVTVDSILKVAEIFSQYLPQLSDSVANEAFNNITTSAKGSFMDSSTKALVLEVASVFIKNLSLGTPRDWPDAFIIFTPFSLLCALLDILPSVELSSMEHYLRLWNGLAATEESFDFILNFLLDAARDVVNELSVKKVFIDLATKNAKKVISALTERLTFAFWWHEMAEGTSESAVPPPAFSFQMSIAIMKTLADIAQTNMEMILPFLGKIIGYSLLFYDRDRSLISELLLILLWGLPNCPDSLSKIFLTPSSLVWADGNIIEWPEEMWREGKSQRFTLRRVRKEPVSVCDFANQLVSFLRKHGFEEIVEEWGRECLRWCTGCGDLTIAGRASLIFSQILKPFDRESLEKQISAFQLVSGERPNENRRFYLSAVLQVFERSVEVFGSEKEFGEELDRIAEIVSPLIGIASEEQLCCTALAICGRHVMSGRASEEKLRWYAEHTIPLYGSLRQHNPIIGMLLGIMGASAKGSMLPYMVMTAMLPDVFQKLSAFHNLSPYSSGIGDEEIVGVIQATILGLGSGCFTEEIRKMRGELEEPENVTPDVFVLGISVRLVTECPEMVRAAAGPLTALLRAASGSLVPAIFTVVRCILSAKVDGRMVGAFSPIVRLSTRRSISQAVSLQEQYLARSGLMNGLNDGVEKRVGEEAEKGEIPMTPQWETVAKQIGEAKLVRITGATDLTTAPIMSPLDLDTWNGEGAVKARKAFEGAIAEPFGTQEEELKMARKKIVDRRGGDVVIDTSIANYTKYRDIS